MSADTPGATILGCHGPVLLPKEAAFFRQADPWGFIIFARNVETGDQLRRLTSALRDAVGRDAPILVDQEGGRVQRLRAPEWRDWCPPLEETGPEAIRLRYRLIAGELRAVGIDVNCAPLADLAGPLTHPFLRNRCFGGDAATVVPAARAAAEGLLAGGVLPVLKHIPGHGRATADSHFDLPRVSAPADELAKSDFAAFHALRDLPMAMTAHIVFEDIDPELPATSSPRMMRLIREEIGFGGLIMTDDLSMKALSGDMASRSRAAIEAGCDIALHCNGDPEEMAAVVEGAGRLTPAAAARADAALGQRHAPDDADITALAREYAALARTAAQSHG